MPNRVIWEQVGSKTEAGGESPPPFLSPACLHAYCRSQLYGVVFQRLIVAVLIFLEKSGGKIWKILQEGVLLHPLSEGGMSTWTVWRGMDEGIPCFPAWRRGALEKNFEKSCRKIWRGIRKVFIFAPAESVYLCTRFRS